MSTTARTTTRRDFDLPEEDVDFLDALGLRWETVVAKDGGLWVFVHRYPLPSGYCADGGGRKQLATATVGIRVTGYPGGALDMAYFSPPLGRVDGKGIGAISPLQIEDQAFQQWSRHYTGNNPFRVGIDSFGTHFTLVEEWLRRELAK